MKLLLTEAEVREYYSNAKANALHMERIHWPFTRQHKDVQYCMSRDWLRMYKRLLRYERTFSERLWDALVEAPLILGILMAYTVAMCACSLLSWLIISVILFVRKVKQ